MGLTHYWKRKPELSAESFVGAVADCRLVLGRLNIALAGADGTGTAIIERDGIHFNGLAPASCESFDVHRIQTGHMRNGMILGFCKTHGLPYDLCVKLSLIIFEHHLAGDMIVSSDQNMDAWAAAKAICAEHVGYGHRFELSKS